MRSKVPNGCTSRDKHAVRVERQAVDDGVVSGQILYELAVGEFPLFDVVRCTARKRVSAVANKPVTRLHRKLLTPSAQNRPKLTEPRPTVYKVTKCSNLKVHFATSTRRQTDGKAQLWYCRESIWRVY